jgi:hypothetical protein
MPTILEDPISSMTALERREFERRDQRALTKEMGKTSSAAAAASTTKKRKPRPRKTQAPGGEESQATKRARTETFTGGIDSALLLDEDNDEMFAGQKAGDAFLAYQPGERALFDQRIESVVQRRHDEATPALRAMFAAEESSGTTMSVERKPTYVPIERAPPNLRDVLQSLGRHGEAEKESKASLPSPFAALRFVPSDRWDNFLASSTYERLELEFLTPVINGHSNHLPGGRRVNLVQVARFVEERMAIDLWRVLFRFSDTPSAEPLFVAPLTLHGFSQAADEGSVLDEEDDGDDDDGGNDDSDDAGWERLFFSELLAQSYMEFMATQRSVSAPLNLSNVKEALTTITCCLDFVVDSRTQLYLRLIYVIASLPQDERRRAALLATHRSLSALQELTHTGSFQRLLKYLHLSDVTNVASILRFDFFQMSAPSALGMASSSGTTTAGPETSERTTLSSLLSEMPAAFAGYYYHIPMESDRVEDELIHRTIRTEFVIANPQTLIHHV